MALSWSYRGEPVNMVIHVVFPDGLPIFMSWIRVNTQKIQVYTFIVASEKKNTRGGAIRNPKKSRYRLL